MVYILSMANPYCAAVIINNSDQDSSSRIVWSFNGICPKEGIDLAHLTAKNNNLAADSNIVSRSMYKGAGKFRLAKYAGGGREDVKENSDEAERDGAGDCVVFIPDNWTSSELVTSSSFAAGNCDFEDCFWGEIKDDDGVIIVGKSFGTVLVVGIDDSDVEFDRIWDDIGFEVMFSE